MIIKEYMNFVEVIILKRKLESFIVITDLTLKNEDFILVRKWINVKIVYISILLMVSIIRILLLRINDYKYKSKVVVYDISKTKFGNVRSFVENNSLRVEILF